MTAWRTALRAGRRDVAPGALGNWNIGSPFRGAQIAPGSLDGTRIAPRSIRARNLLAETITAREIFAETITYNELADGAVIHRVLGDAAVETDKVFADAITSITTFSSDTPSSGQFINQAITRTANTKLVMIVTINPAQIDWVGDTVTGDDLFQRLVIKRGSTTLTDSGNTIPLWYYYVDPAGLSYNNQHGSNGISNLAFQQVDIANVSGSQTYTMAWYQGTSGTSSAAFNGYRVTAIEYKR